LKPIYLDHNASTPILPEVLDAMLPYLRDRYGNPSSSHAYGRELHAAIEKAREQLGDLIGCSPADLYFTSGGTEASNLAIRGVAGAVTGRRHILTSTIEHPATLSPCLQLEGQGYTVDRTPVDEYGQVVAEQAIGLMRDDTGLVTMVHANGETGTIQAIAEIALAAGEKGALIHSDAAQSVGKIDVNVDALGIDLMSIAGHKMYGPVGVGALYVRSGTPIRPVVVGAGHEHGLRPGTENTAGIVGLGAACAIARRTLSEEGPRVRRLRDRLWGHLAGQVPGIALNGHPEERLPNTLNVRFPGVSGNELLAACPGIAASTGSACHETSESPSDVITAMGVPAQTALGSVRLSLGRFTTRENVNQAASELAAAWKKMVGD
jgi:cysteine desulfurase